MLVDPLFKNLTPNSVLDRKAVSMVRGLGDGTIRLVNVQLTFTNISLVPKCIPCRGDKTPSEFLRDSDEIPGELCFDPVEDVGCSDVVAELEALGYVLVDAFYTILKKDGRDFASVRFIFVIAEHAGLSESFAKIVTQVRASLQELLSKAMWKVSLYINHYFYDGVLIDDVFSFSISLAKRNPLFEADGSPVMRWQRDEAGEKIGEQKFRLTPKNYLRVVGTDVLVVSEQQ